MAGAPDQPSVVIFGCGYVGQEFGARMIQRGWRVVGTVRSPGRFDALTSVGIQPLAFDNKLSGDLLRVLLDCDAILCSIPADEDGDPAIRALEGAEANPKWVGYLSTTAVYGNRDGGWAFEADPPTPTSTRARARMTAETAWRTRFPSAQVFRLPGIYGPGRSVFERLTAGSARIIDKPGQVFSRCHRDDIASGLACAAVTSIAEPQRALRAGHVFNLTDDEPCNAGLVTAYAARRLGLPTPPRVRFEQADLSPMARSFYSDSKRVSNARIKAAFGWRPAFPSYREGLDAIIAGSPQAKRQ